MAITTAAPIAPINYTSPLPALLEGFKYLSGTETKTTEGGVQQTQEQKITGQTGPLEVILAQLTDPNNLQNLVASLFSQGAQQVPALTSAYANATGTRTTGNTMLSQSLAQLNQTLAQSIANAIVQQQQTAVGAAGKLAEANKTSSTVTNKSPVTTTQQVGPGNVASGTLKSLVPVLAGTVLNKLGKKGTGIAEAASVEAPISTVSNAPINIASQSFDYPDAFSQANAGIAVPSVLSAPTILPSPAAFDFTSLFSGGEGAEFVGDLLLGDFVSDIGGTGGGEFVGAADELFTGGGAEFVGDLPIGDVAAEGGGSILDDILAGFADFFGFVDGGRISKKRGYADGGQVRPIVRNISNFGTPQRAIGQQALNYAPAPVRLPVPVQQNLAQRKTSKVGDVGNLGDASTEGSDATAVAAMGPASNMAIAPSQMLAIMSAILAPNPVSIANAALALTTGKTALQHVTSLIPSVNITVPANQPNPATGADVAPVAPDPVGSVSISVPDMPPGFDPATGETAEGTTGDIGEGVGPEGGDTAATAAADAASADAGTGDSGSDAGSADGSAFIDGGKVKGKKGTDKVPIMATTGEYVLPVDVVQFIGKDNLDELVAFLHAPVAGGTRG